MHLVVWMALKWPEHVADQYMDITSINPSASVGLLIHFMHLINARNMKHIKLRNYNLPMSLRDGVVHNFVISHSYRSTCLSQQLVRKAG